MADVKKSGIGKTKGVSIICVVLVVALAFSNVWFFIGNNSLQNQVNNLETQKSDLQSQVSSLEADKSNLQSQVDSLNAQIESLNTQIAALQSNIDSLESHIDVLRSPKQIVVNYLEGNFGFDVTFVYFGSNKSLTYGAEDGSVVVMTTDEHVKNFQFTETQEQQFSEGKNALQQAYPNAEAFLVFIWEDLDRDGVPDPSVNGYFEISGGVYGGRTETAFTDDYWKYAEYYIRQW